jgi:transcriptional regulator with XRE-family HTH domain
MQSIGERLEEARKRKGVSIREAAEATKIRGDYLQKLETNKFDLGLTPLYVRGFLRNYAHWLKLPADKMVGEFDALGLDSPRTARPINREVYGRMDLSAAGKAGDEPRGETAAAPEVRPSPALSARSRKPTPFSARATAEPSSNRAAIIQFGGLVLGVVLIMALAVWGVMRLIGPGKAAAPVADVTASAHAVPATDISTPPPPAPVSQAAIVALAAVTVQVWAENPDGTYGKVLLPETALQQGESRSVPRNGPLYILASAGEKLRIDVEGKPFFPGEKGVKGSQAFELR